MATLANCRMLSLSARDCIALRTALSSPKRRSKLLSALVFMAKASASASAGEPRQEMATRQSRRLAGLGPAEEAGAVTEDSAHVSASGTDSENDHDDDDDDDGDERR